jgi:hypothetical protein
MQFRECINCPSLSCTLKKVCFLSPDDPGPNWERGPYNLADTNDSREDHASEPEHPCNARSTHNGLCPCCGVEIESSNAPDSGGGLHDECMSCGWESDIYYDW